MMHQSDDLIDQVIQMSFLNQYIYSKIQFDNAKDADALLEAAQQNAEMMLTAAKTRLIPLTEELIERRLQKLIKESVDSSGAIALQVGGEMFTVKIVQPHNKEETL